MRYSELIQLYFERSTALQWYWTLYVVVIGGLLAFSSIRKRPDAITGILVTVLYCCFAYKNLGAIQDTLTQRQAVLQAIRDVPLSATNAPATNGVGDRLNATLVEDDPRGTRLFHLACDVLTVAAIWAMELRRVRAARAEQGKQNELSA